MFIQIWPWPNQGHKYEPDGCLLLHLPKTILESWMAKTLMVGGSRLAQYLAVADLPLQLKHLLVFHRLTKKPKEHDFVKYKLHIPYH
jgi:hypothetical protein